MTRFRTTIALVLSVTATTGIGSAAVAAVPPSLLAPAAGTVPAIGHVWTIVLENSEFAQTFVAGRNNAPYLTQTLPSLGKLVVQYFGTGHSSADNYVAMASGQGPNPSTQGDCDSATTLGDNPAATPPVTGAWHFDADGQAVDDSGAPTIGCTYPPGVKTLSDQLDSVGRTWKAYMENMDAEPDKASYCSDAFADETTDVGAPPKRVDAQNPTNPNYKDKHDPWAYFHATFDDRTYCTQHVVPLGFLDATGQNPQGQLVDDLASIDTTPDYSFLTPDQCHDGHDACASSAGNALAGADQFLKAFVPVIMNSPAYKKDGLIVILFDEGSTDLACCGEKTAPNLTLTQGNGDAPGPVADGGGMTGAILLSPFVTPGSTDATSQFNHYSYLRSMEDMFGVTTGGLDGQGHLAYAGEPGLVTFQQAGEFNASPASGGTPAAPTSGR
jgi:hypothetical protein